MKLSIPQTSPMQSTCEQRVASGWKKPLTNRQNSWDLVNKQDSLTPPPVFGANMQQHHLYLSSHRPWMPMQQGRAVSRQVWWTGTPRLTADVRRQTGHREMSWDHWLGGVEAGEAQ